MALWVHVHGGYPSYRGNGEAWTSADYDALKLVKALKGLPFNGYATLQTPSGSWVTIRENDRTGAFRIFGEWAATKLKELGLENAVLVPVPSSSCTAQGTDAKGRALSVAVNQRSPNTQLAEALWWREALPKAAQGGARRAEVLEENLQVHEFPPAQIVLIDDVVSSGGHLTACARLLRAQGHTVEHAICAAQTVNTHPENMWAIESRDLEADQFAALLFGM